MIVVIGEALLGVLQADRARPLARPGESPYIAAVDVGFLASWLPSTDTAVRECVAALRAALTCARPGADPSRGHELAAANLSIEDTHIPAEPIRFRAGNTTGCWR